MGLTVARTRIVLEVKVILMQVLVACGTGYCLSPDIINMHDVSETAVNQF